MLQHNPPRAIVPVLASAKSGSHVFLYADGMLRIGIDPESVEAEQRKQDATILNKEEINILGDLILKIQGLPS